MKKSKGRSKPQGEDRLSELPDSVIFQILRSVPMIDAVRTTILSKRWKNLWTTLPFLNLDGDLICQRRFRRLVNQFLFRWNGVRILELRLCYRYDDLLSSEIELWVNFAVEKGVEGLYLHGNPEYMHYDKVCLLPQCLCSCSSLKLLSLQNCKLPIVEYVQWNKLKNLRISQGFEVTEHVINQILCGSPLLEVFKLSFLDKGQNLSIRSRSLKELTIHKYLYYCGDFDSEYTSLVSVSELTIWTPNLETLKIKGIPFGKCRLISIPSSTHVTIGFCDLYFFEEDRLGPPDVAIGFIGDRFDQILQLIKHVESVELICVCIQVLGPVKEGCTYLNVKSLVVRNRFCNYYVDVVGALQLFPHLNSLVLQHNDDGTIYDSHPSLTANIPRSFRLQLRTIDIIWSEGDDIFPFIEFLLKYADKLEKMVFRVQVTSPHSLLLASQELLRMPRSSPSCTIITTPYTKRYSS